METNSSRIPKIIHYCWFGGNEMPDELKECVQTWKDKLSDYELVCCNEQNCTFDENEFIKKAYKDKKWAFVSDYYRLKRLYEMGGIYLDTDVKVYKSFDKLLNHPAFFNFIFDSAIGSAVIGAEPHNKFIGELLQLYENTTFGKTTNGKNFQKDGERVILSDYATNNYYFTYYALEKYKDLKLNNKYQQFDDFVLFPKELFETGSALKRHYAIHLCTGTWRKKNEDSHNPKETIKGILAKCPGVFDYVQIIARKIRYRKLNKRIPFYVYQVAQKKGEDYTLS